MSTRIITFLGLGKDAAPPHYKECRYQLDDCLTPEPTAIHDAVTVMRYANEPVSLLVLGTEKVRGRWFGENQLFRELLNKALPPNVPRPKLGFDLLPDGKTDSERWEIFDKVVRALAPDPQELHDPVAGTSYTELESPSTLILDITHGFRSQPFFAASAVQFSRSQLKRGRSISSVPDLRILYAAFEAKAGDIAPVWDLTQFTKVIAWDSAIEGLLRHGRSDDLQDLLDGLQSSLVQGAHGSKKPKLKKLGGAVTEFADSLVTARVPALLTRVAGRLREAIMAARDDVVRNVPPLAPQLTGLDDWVRPMIAEEPLSREGLGACLHLAGVYKETERYAELTSLLREALVGGYTLSVLKNGAAIQPAKGDNKFGVQRKEMDERLGELSRSRESTDPLVNLYNKVGDLRNDVMHSGFRENPRRARKIRSDIEKYLDETEHCLLELGLIPERHGGSEVSVRASSTYLVTRHPGTQDWARQEGIVVDRVVDHLDVEQIQSGDVVIGSLSVSLAAQVCDRGGRYKHISLDLPSDLRGEELTADDMRALGARIEEFMVSR